MARQFRNDITSLVSTEQGTVVKEWGGKLPIVLAYANNYAVGMSSLAVHSLYRWFNEFPDVVCERAFAWLGRQQLQGQPLLTLETQRPVRDAEVLAVSLSFEMDYLNLLAMLRHAGIPLRADEREEEIPLVLLGGPAVSANPEPLAAVADAVVIGEIEPVLPILVETLKRSLFDGRLAALHALTELPGLYVPSLNQGQPVTRQVQPELDAYLVASALQCPRAQFGDMHLVEISRGCEHACRFCLAGCWYLPQRERSLTQVMQQVELGTRRGQSVGLVAAAVSDYTQLDELLDRSEALNARLSVSSLRVNKLSSRLLRVLAASGDRTLTLAPEAGSERLRQLTHKGVTEDDILSAASLASGFSFEALKLYFMIGLPTETETDIADIVTLSARVQSLFGKTVLVNVTPYVPKAHTTWQRQPMAPENELEEKLKQLKAALSARRIGLRAESVRGSVAQSLLARGDRALGERLLGLTQYSSAELLKAFRPSERAMMPALQGFDAKQQLPWHFIKRAQHDAG